MARGMFEVVCWVVWRLVSSSREGIIYKNVRVNKLLYTLFPNHLILRLFLDRDYMPIGNLLANAYLVL
jgi:hypothetical protein